MIIPQHNAAGLLMNHAGLADGPRFANGLLGMLRPYRGILEQNLHEVVGCLHALKFDFQKDTVDRMLVLAILTLVTTIKDWGIDASSMLRRNRLLDDATLKRLEKWSLVIESVFRRYLSKLSDAVALYHYLEYLITYDVADQLDETAVLSAIDDAFHQDDDYKLLSFQVCIKYPAVGRQFRSKAASLLSVTPPSELRDKLVEVTNLAD